MLASGEFNRFYMRGLCLHAINNNYSIVVYRAKYSINPRPNSEEKIGMTVLAKTLLQDLRSNIGIDTFLRLPAGSNSGLSIKLA